MSGTLYRKTGRVALNPRSHRGFVASPLPIRAVVSFHRARAYRNEIHRRGITYTNTQSKFAWNGILGLNLAGRTCLLYAISTQAFRCVVTPLRCESLPHKPAST